MSLTQRIFRISLLSAAAAAFLFWICHHAEVSIAEGLRSIRVAQTSDGVNYAGSLLQSIDHPLHPLAIAAAQRLLGGAGPYVWQTAAQCASVIALVLAVLPIYLLGRDLFEDDTTGLLGCILFFNNPIVGLIAVNVLSETTFLLFWTWGSWTSVRFLREGRFNWLPWAIGFGALAYLTRPEGLLLHLALVTTLILLPLHRLTRINWPRWRAAVALLVLGPAVLVGPYMAYKGGVGTRPAVARVIGTLPQSTPEALEREQPFPTGQTVLQTYAIAIVQVFKALSRAVTWPLIPLSVIGLMAMPPSEGRSRVWLFQAVIISLSSIALVRLHATGGYCTNRHALVPALIFTLAAAHGLAWLMRSVVVDAKKLGLGEGRLRPGPAVWALLLATAIAWPLSRSMTPYNSGFAPYRMAGWWIAHQPDSNKRVLDLTDWSLFFSDTPGYGISKADEVSQMTGIRYLVLNETQLKSTGHLGALARNLVANRDPVARFPEHLLPNQLQVIVYDLSAGEHEPASLAVENRDSAVR